MIIMLAVGQAAGWIHGPVAPEIALEELAPYTGLLDLLRERYQEHGTHEPVQAAYIGLREELQQTEAAFFRALEQRLRGLNEASGAAPDVPALKTITGTQLLAMEFPEPREAIPNLVVGCASPCGCSR
jgi:hypothetical protein